MSTVRERIGWIVEHGKVPDTGEAWDAQSLSIASSLAPAHIGMILRGTIGEPRQGTLEKIARASGTSLLWLLTGQGEPGAVAAEPVVGEAVAVQAATPAATPAASPDEEPLIERAIAKAFDSKNHWMVDLRAVSEAVTADGYQWQHSETEMTAAARRWLDAAVALRKSGARVTALALLDQITFSKGDASSAPSTSPSTEIDGDRAASGVMRRGDTAKTGS